MVLASIFGPTGFLANHFLHPQGILITLGILIPLILLYLIRPKPVNVAVPSLMFILNDLGKSNVHRFFRTIFRDILFLLQALAIILLGLAMAKPFIEVSQESLVKQSILIVDVSASTRAFDDERFDEIIDASLNHLSSDNIIVVARANPYIIEKNDDVRMGAADAEEYLRDLIPSDMQGDIPTALDLAAQHAAPQTKVVIISDLVLSSLESTELIEAKMKVLRSKGAIVETEIISGEGENVGIIDATLNAQNATVELKIQNFDAVPREIGLEYNDKAIILPKNILEPEGKPGSLLTVSVPLAHGKSEFKLTPNDDFTLDNLYHVSIPTREAINVLIISNDQAVQSSKLIAALSAAGDQFTKVNIQYAVPPKVPDLAHEVYIIKDVNPEFVLPGVIKELRDKVSQGAILVVFSQPGLFGINTEDMLPVTPKVDAPPLGSKQELQVNSSLGLLRGLSYIGQVDGSQLQRVAKTDDALVHAFVSTNDGPEPVIAHKRIGKGVVIYYGIRDQKTVDLDPQSYAVIWGRIIDYSLPDIQVLNIGTGTVLTSQNTIMTPIGKQAPPLITSRQGFYEVGENSIAANLYPMHMLSAAADTNIQYESTISRSANITSSETIDESEEEDVKVPKDLTLFVIIGGMSVMFLELLYVKFRGDL